MREGVVPDETGGGPGEGIYPIFTFPARITARKPSRKLALDIFVGNGAVRPLVAIAALHARAISIVEQHKFAGDLVLVRSAFFSEDAEIGIAVSLLHVAEHLVVSAVLLQDINHVFEKARLADA